MSRSVAQRVDQAEGKSLDLPLIGAVGKGQAPVKAVESGWILPLIGKAIDRTMQRKEAAILLGIDHGQMTRQLSGDGHLSTLRLGALPQEFWIALIDELRAHYKLDDPQARVQQAMDLVSRGMAMLVSEVKR
jgi:hypothetical protein